VRKFPPHPPFPRKKKKKKTLQGGGFDRTSVSEWRAMTYREASVRVSEANARRIIDSDHGDDNGIIFSAFAMRMMPVFGRLLSVNPRELTIESK
jgi:hypothetical protein